MVRENAGREAVRVQMVEPVMLKRLYQLKSAVCASTSKVPFA